ncbi:dUTP diphosphatase [Bacillus atrophaeus]|uniref:dUTP diphosphatase n=1 Tax=Bacillus atrophaeus TaxID=1452 RepID=UPI002DBAD378|nr:dUTP diphosphatase [Bacillus atrophaeus]MEC0765069.1 dUTP diphosphatase [Bacillus atrophaeus]MEC0778260.1 dUTP diphosphatase [Bacillus atrophaeus]MEC0808296.1 dUTP diphosphatase [Bacillus atrophaeus]
MNLEKMFEMQKVLDDRIIKEKGLEGQDLLPNLILALQVELAECANEWRGFKHWSNDREPRTKHPLEVSPNGAFRKGGNPLLEEYVDCLHFILSIGNRLGINDSDTICDIHSEYLRTINGSNTAKLFSFLFSISYSLLHRNLDKETYINLFTSFFTLGEQLGFTGEQVEAAYMEKNAVNHQRQQEGY